MTKEQQPRSCCLLLQQKTRISNAVVACCGCILIPLQLIAFPKPFGDPLERRYSQKTQLRMMLIFFIRRRWFLQLLKANDQKYANWIQQLTYRILVVSIESRESNNAINNAWAISWQMKFKGFGMITEPEFVSSPSLWICQDYANFVLHFGRQIFCFPLLIANTNWLHWTCLCQSKHANLRYCICHHFHTTTPNFRHFATPTQLCKRHSENADEKTREKSWPQNNSQLSAVRHCGLLLCSKRRNENAE
jgi:hypothetical protein